MVIKFQSNSAKNFLEYFEVLLGNLRKIFGRFKNDFEKM